MALQQQSQGTVAPTVQTSWNSIFPANLETKAQSTNFVKKLVAVAVSGITYVRGVFPEAAYARKSLDGLPVRILKERNDYEEAGTLASYLAGAFDALERKYLKELILVAHLDPADQDTAFEMYTFRFSYKDGEAAIEVEGGAGRKITKEAIQRDTQSLLRSILVLTQSLPPIPDDYHISVKLTYYDDVTPQDYEPRGFVPAERVVARLPAGVGRLQCGKVATRHHALGLRAHTAAPEQEPGEGTAAVEREAAGPDFPAEGPEQQQDAINDTRTQDDNDLCICENAKPDPLMLECGHCGRLEHAACYRILQEDQLPDRHCCVRCGQDEGRDCTDPKTARMFKNNQRSAAAPTCLFRRVLAALADEQIVNLAWICQRFGLDREPAEQVLGKLEEIEVLNQTDVGKFAVDQQDKMLQAWRKFLGVKTGVEAVLGPTGPRRGRASVSTAPLGAGPSAAGDGRRSGEEEGATPRKRRKSSSTARVDI